MKILVVSHEFPPIGGGGASACYNLIKGYVDAGHEVTVVTANFENLPYEEYVNGAKIIRVHAKRANKEHCSFQEMASYLLKAWPVINKLAKENKFDLCQVFFGIPSGPLGYLLKKKYKIPYVIRFGGGDIPGFQDRFAVVYKIIGPFLKIIWKNADALIANSVGLKKMALDFYDKCEIQIISNGVDTEYFKPGEDEYFGETYRVLFASRLIERKGLQFLIPYLMEIMEKTNKKVTLTVVGDGPYRSFLEQQVKDCSVSEYVNFVGQKNKAEILEYYQNADIFVLPSKKEGMPNVVLEAMACGLPIIMTPCEGSQELVKDNGIVSPIDKLPKAIQKVICDDTLRNEMARNSRKLAINEFSWNQKVAMYLKLFEEILN